MQQASPTLIGCTPACASRELLIFHFRRPPFRSETSFQPPLRLVFWPSLILMRWLLIALLVSLAALLIAAAGMTIHILVQRARLRSKPSAGDGKLPDSPPDSAEENDVETEN